MLKGVVIMELEKVMEMYKSTDIPAPIPTGIIKEENAGWDCDCSGCDYSHDWKIARDN